MSYGIKTFNGNGDITLDTSVAGISGLKIVGAGTAASMSLSQAYRTRIFDKAKNQVFVRIQPTSGNSDAVAFDSLRSGAGADFRPPGIPGATQPSQVVDYIVTERFVDEGTNSSPGYGVRLYDDNGDLEFDSSTLLGFGGVSLKNVIPSFSREAKPNTKGNLITDNLNDYVDISWGFWTFNNIGYTGLAFYNNVTDGNGDSMTGAAFISDGEGGYSGGFSVINETLPNPSPILVLTAGGSV